MKGLTYQWVSVSDWHPLVLILLALIVAVVVYLLYRMGNPSYKETKYKREPFLSGNRSPEDSDALHIGGSNLYWGFTRALKNYFEPLVKGHTGILNDYLYWLIITIAVVMVVVYIV